MTEIPGFEVRRELGSSAAATVYLALQTSLDREVALKVMAQTLIEDAALTQRFIQEARTLASLAHPHIVAVYDVDTAPDRRPYFSMQYLPGGDLAARVGRGLSESALVETLGGVAQALEYVHQRGLVHRDVRPTNVLYDDSGMPILTDFGIARAMGSASNTGTDFSAATGHYMSPEQARGGTLDARADLYSLGALTWFGLTGRPPYDGADGFAVAYAHVFEAIPRLPPEKAHWQPLVDRALAKEPSLRFASAREFLDALSQISVGADQAASDEAATRAFAVLQTAPAEPPAAPAPAVQSDAYATQQRPLPDLSAAMAPPAPAAPPAVAPPAVPETPVREPDAGKAEVKPEAAAPAPATGPTITRRRPVVPPPARAPATEAPAPRSATRWWPLAAIAAGIAVVGFAGYLQFGGQRAKDAKPASGQVAASSPAPAAAPAPEPAPAPSPPAPSSSDAAAATALAPALSSSPPAANPSTDSAAAAAAPAPQADATQDAASKSAATDATALPSLDAAAEAAAFVKMGDPALLPTVGDPMNEGIRLGRIYLAMQRLAQPRGNNALEFFQYVLKRDPRSKAAKQGIVDIAKKYVELADKAGPDQNAVLQNLASADDIAKTLDEAADVRKDIAARRAKLAEPYLAQARTAIADWNKAEAKAAYEKVLQIDPNNAAARDGLKTAAMIGEPGYAFRDKSGPEMVVLGGGRAAVARRDVTRGEFRRFWAAAGSAQFGGREPACRDRESIFRSGRDRTWQSPGFEQDDSHPVVCVSWAEAAAYAQWLARETGKRYRLLSAGEFDQIASRASDCSSANLADAAYNKKFDSKDGASCDDGFAATAPAGRFEAGSNVRLWVNACGNGAAASAACRDHLAKGRSWASAAKDAASDNFSNDVGLNTVGFRVARDIE